MATSKRTPPAEIVERAKDHRGQWLYEIVGTFGPHDPVPPEAIRGVWKVNDAGEIEGDFIPNAKFRPIPDEF